MKQPTVPGKGKTSPSKPSSPRNPERTSSRILKAALTEFAAKGFAGARVNAIARRANINKRMLYHYYGDKAGLFRAALLKKIAERQEMEQALVTDPPAYFQQRFTSSCRDWQWVRMLQWEALNYPQGKILEHSSRLASNRMSIKKLREGQQCGAWPGQFAPEHLLLAVHGLVFFPLAFPQLTRMITGREIHDPVFQKNHLAFLRQISLKLCAPDPVTNARPPRGGRKPAS